ncbi:MAG TPA: gamma carbonic anhydrase family protein [Saprospiraceae bacterium]|nr:gamma carbonic anhydrase family protein [Saprospiraceae bacterium]
MPLIQSVRGKHPRWGKDVFIAENATIVGDVTMGDRCSVWFQAVIRGDVNAITIGNEVNIQDGVIIHGTYEKAATQVGDQVSVGHRAILHGCTIQSRVLVGMGAIVMDHAVVEENVLIAAGTVILENSRLESGYIYAGVPGKKVKPLNAESFQFFIDRTAKNYQLYASWFEPLLKS